MNSRVNNFKLEPPEPSEAEIQRAVLQCLRMHAGVAWAHRFNTGAHVVESMGRDGRMNRSFLRYAFKGCPDILGQLKDGRFLAVECKTRNGRTTPEQKRFLEVVEKNRGVAFVARSIDDVIERLSDG